MEQFSLEKYLENPSRKLVTRDGMPARIVCWDRNTKYWKIVGLVTSPDGSTENPFTYDVNGNESDGCLHDHKNDLFFADEEEELTEFEKCVQNILNEPHFQDIEAVKQFSKTLLDLARKEVEKEITKEVEQKAINHTYAYQNGYENGKYDALKNLPKWKKAKKDEELDCHVAIQQDDRVVLSDFVQKDEYYITLDALKKLPKEE